MSSYLLATVNDPSKWGALEKRGEWVEETSTTENLIISWAASQCQQTGIFPCEVWTKDREGSIRKYKVEIDVFPQREFSEFVGKNKDWKV